MDGGVGASPGRQRPAVTARAAWADPGFEDLRGAGYEGGYAVRRYATARKRKQGTGSSDAFVPLTFAPGEAYQFDWSHEIVLLRGATTEIKVAQVRLCNSRMLFVRAYPREMQEMVFDAHDCEFMVLLGKPDPSLRLNSCHCVDLSAFRAAPDGPRSVAS